MPMFPPEEIEAAKERELARERECAQTIARRIRDTLAADDIVLKVTVFETSDSITPAIVNVELLDGTELTVQVTRTPEF